MNFHQTSTKDYMNTNMSPYMSQTSVDRDYQSTAPVRQPFVEQCPKCGYCPHCGRDSKPQIQTGQQLASPSFSTPSYMEPGPIVPLNPTSSLLWNGIPQMGGNTIGTAVDYVGYRM